MIEVTQTEYDTYVATLVNPIEKNLGDYCGFEIVEVYEGSYKKAIKHTNQATGIVTYNIKSI